MTESRRSHSAPKIGHDPPPEDWPVCVGICRPGKHGGDSPSGYGVGLSAVVTGKPLLGEWCGRQSLPRPSGVRSSRFHSGHRRSTWRSSQPGAAGRLHGGVEVADLPAAADEHIHPVSCSPVADSPW
jgi:hypothetical protein